MKPLLGTFYLLGMLVPGWLGYDRSLTQQRQEVVDKVASPWRILETYSYNRYHPMGEIYQWMSEIREKYTEVVTQHFLGMTYESRPMYYLKDRLWRKSRSSHNNGTCFGTDLNRNFDASWCSIGASNDCESLTFCGTGPVSEPETKAVSSFIESKKENIACFLTMHSYGQLILVPYGYTKNKSNNHEELIQVGQKAANALKAKHGTNYRVGSSADILYATSGSSRDWARDIGIPFSYTFELRDNGTYGFVLPEAQIQATCEETMEAVLSVLDDVYEKYWYTNSARKAKSTALVLSLLMSFMSLL
ncbi:carboxypeptidase O isoform X2 [Cervus elaphus]|uniref:carboxypeptidase O isoform X2 n=1 Tax=Cervus canadensis TaxID=1574408 RepID=UPI001CA33915|nr:carboxypeptidase O isoform X2 [Cervus canadensis]XP_043766558.1 carboxypeptidase O isoform X2 [Cervus elaphus]